MAIQVIGIVGPIASGKGEVVKILQSRGFAAYSLSDVLREILKDKGVPITRENLIALGNKLRTEMGQQVLAELISERHLQELEGPIVIESIRNPGEVDFLKSHHNAQIWGVDADINLREEWYIARLADGNRGEDAIPREEVRRILLTDLGVGESATGQQVATCLELADHTIHNEGSLDDLEGQVLRLLELHSATEGQPMQTRK